MLYETCAVQIQDIYVQYIYPINGTVKVNPVTARRGCASTVPVRERFENVARTVRKSYQVLDKQSAVLEGMATALKYNCL